MNKKWALIGLVAIGVILFFGSKVLNTLNMNNTTQQQPPVTTQPTVTPSLIDRVEVIEEDIADIKRDVISDSTNTAMIKSMLEELTKQIAALRAEVKALK